MSINLDKLSNMWKEAFESRNSFMSSTCTKCGIKKPGTEMYYRQAYWGGWGEGPEISICYKCSPELKTKDEEYAEYCRQEDIKKAKEEIPIQEKKLKKLETKLKAIQGIKDIADIRKKIKEDIKQLKELLLINKKKVK